MDQVGRRRFVTALGATALANSLVSLAQRTSKVPRIGILMFYAAETEAGRIRRRWVQESLTRLGYTVGTDVFIEWRHHEDRPERISKFVDEFVRLKLDVIVAWGSADTHAAARATKTIPIVMLSYGGDPVKMGLAASLARPGGNVTGNQWFVDLTDLVVKRYEILRQAVPAAARIASMWTPWTPNPSDSFRIVDEINHRVRKGFGWVVTDFVVPSPEEVPAVLDRIAAFKPDALYVGYLARLPEITTFAIQQKLVTIGHSPSVAQEGGLLFYGPDSSHLVYRAMSFVDRILRGAKPGNLPIEQPLKYQLIFNAKTARAIGYTLPPDLQLRVTQVIE